MQLNLISLINAKGNILKELLNLMYSRILIVAFFGFICKDLMSRAAYIN